MANLEAIIWYIFLLDSLIANLAAWFFPKDYIKKYKKIAKHFPITKAWCFMYLVFVLWVGWALSRLAILPW
jgi:hypothetical protein